MKRLRTFYLLPLALAAVLTGCSSSDDESVPAPRPVRLTVSSGSMAETRAADGLYTASTGFSGGEAVRIYMKDAGDARSAVYDVGSPTDGKSPLTVSTGQTALEYPEEGDVTLYGIYPAASETAHVVRRDQTSTTDGNANYRLSDLMYAVIAVPQAQQEEPQELTFNHQLVKLKVIVNKAADLHQVTGLTLGNVLRKVPVTAVSGSGITLGTAVAAATSDPDYSTDAAVNNSILLGAEETASDVAETYTYVCVFPAQAWASTTTFLTVDVDDDQIAFSANKSFVGGTTYVATLNIDASMLSAVGVSPLWAGPLATR